MKLVGTIFCFLFINNSFSQFNITEVSKTESLIAIWGLLKYNHPEVSKGKFDMNQEFINEFVKIQNIENQEQLNASLLNWVEKFDSKKSKYKTETTTKAQKKIFTKNVYTEWIDQSNFDSTLATKLKRIATNMNIGSYYASISSLNNMVSFKNEKGIENFDSSNKAHRILFLSSFWNAMKYWNVNLYLTDQPWSKTLVELLPEFIENGAVNFEVAKDKLFSMLNDSHADYANSYLLEKKLNRFAYVGGKIINDSLVITRIYDSNLARENKIELGDVVFSVDTMPLKKYYLHKFSNSVSASNLNYLRARIELYFLLASSDKDSLKIGLVKKSGEKQTKFLKLDKISNFKNELYSQLEQPISNKWTKISDDIGYLNLNYINKKELKSAFDAFKTTKGIIIDLRNYPQNINESDIANFLLPEKTVFLKVLAPIFPSYGKFDIDAPLAFIHNPFAVGKTNANFYKGKVILLVNRKTASKAEYIGMAIQQAPNCITIGEQTFGAVMNRTTIGLIDKTTIDFTGMGAFYPDGTEVQRKGLKIDFEIKESARNYDHNLYIEKATLLIEK